MLFRSHDCFIPPSSLVDFNHLVASIVKLDARGEFDKICGVGTISCDRVAVYLEAHSTSSRWCDVFGLGEGFGVADIGISFSEGYIFANISTRNALSHIYGVSSGKLAIHNSYVKIKYNKDIEYLKVYPICNPVYAVDYTTDCDSSTKYYGIDKAAYSIDDFGSDAYNGKYIITNQELQNIATELRNLIDSLSNRDAYYYNGVDAPSDDVGADKDICYSINKKYIKENNEWVIWNHMDEFDSGADIKIEDGIVYIDYWGLGCWEPTDIPVEFFYPEPFLDTVIGSHWATKYQYYMFHGNYADPNFGFVSVDGDTCVLTLLSRPYLDKPYYSDRWHPHSIEIGRASCRERV